MKIYIGGVSENAEKLNALSVFSLVLSLQILLLLQHPNKKMHCVLANPIFKKQIQTVLKRQHERYVFYSTMEFLKKNVKYDIKASEEMRNKIIAKKVAGNLENPSNIKLETKLVAPETDMEKGVVDIFSSKKGHGGGKNTNLEGKSFEALTENIPKLLEQGFVYDYWNKTSKHAFTLSKTFDYNTTSSLAIPVFEGGGEGAVDNIGEKRILYLAQAGFKTFMKNEYGLNFPRYPDEAYLVAYSNGRKVLKILEKKAQHVEGSADTKLMAANAFREEYQFFGEGKFEVEYAFCLNAFFKEKFHSESAKNRKYIFLQQLLKKEGIEVFYGEDADYFDRLSEWIHRDIVISESG